MVRNLGADIVIDYKQDDADAKIISEGPYVASLLFFFFIKIYLHTIIICGQVRHNLGLRQTRAGVRQDERISVQYLHNVKFAIITKYGSTWLSRGNGEKLRRSRKVQRTRYGK